MRQLRITNMKTVSDWEPYKRLPRAVVREEYSISPCDMCPSHCCHHAAEVSAVEATRMALTLVLPLESFLEPKPWLPEESRADAPASHPVLLEDGPMRLFFRRVAGGGCRFLHDIDGRGRCLAYAVRPGVCRLYPFAFEEEKEGEEGEEVARIAIGTLNFCPVGWLYDESTEAAVAESLAAWRKDLALDEELCARWNDEERPVRDLSAFARFAIKELAPRFGLDEERLYPPARRAFGSRLTSR